MQIYIERSNIIKAIHFLLKAPHAGTNREFSVNRIVDQCFNEISVSRLHETFKPTTEELRYARHLADLDILEMFSTFYVRSHRNYKYSKGRADTASNMVSVLNMEGVNVSLDCYNNWRRSRQYRHIAEAERNLILELLNITPNDYKRLVYAHVAIERVVKAELDSFGIRYSEIVFLDYAAPTLSAEQMPRPPCRSAA